MSRLPRVVSPDRPLGRFNRLRLWCLGIVFVALSVSPALAHTGAGVVGGFSAGFSHPILGFDHLLAMIAVGLWGAQIGGRALWELPVTFPLVMAIGGALGISGVPLPADEVVAEIEQRGRELLASAGYVRYEISAYGRPGRACLHNSNYWQFGDYLGIGAGAHGKLSFPDRIERTARFRHPRRYLEAAAAGDPVEVRQRVSQADLPFEFMLNALRLVDGVPSALFAERTGLPLAAVAHSLRRAVERGLLEPDPAVIRATPLGMRFLNDLQQAFLPAAGP